MRFTSKSFKDGSAAANSPVAVWKVMSPSRKAWDRPEPASERWSLRPPPCPGLACPVEVFGGAEKPEEADDGEVDEVAVSLAKQGVGRVKDGGEMGEDGDVGRVCSFGRVVDIGEGLEEIRQ